MSNCWKLRETRFSNDDERTECENRCTRGIADRERRSERAFSAARSIATPSGSRLFLRVLARCGPLYAVESFSSCRVLSPSLSLYRALPPVNPRTSLHYRKLFAYRDQLYIRIRIYFLLFFFVLRFSSFSAVSFVSFFLSSLLWAVLYHALSRLVYSISSTALRFQNSLTSDCATSRVTLIKILGNENPPIRSTRVIIHYSN